LGSLDETAAKLPADACIRNVSLEAVGFAAEKKDERCVSDFHILNLSSSGTTPTYSDIFVNKER
jgi:hypothetical protein